MSNPCTPKDGKNFQESGEERYCVGSGHMDSIHGMSNFQLTTQESQLLGFYSSTGQGGPGIEKGKGQAGQGGPGTGRHVMRTPGLSQETVGKGLKVRDSGENDELPAKLIVAKRGDIRLEAENGNIYLKARNITLSTDKLAAGNKDGEITIDATRMVHLKAPDVRTNCEKFTCRATQEADIVTSGLMKFVSGFESHIDKAKEGFGTLFELANKSSTLDLGLKEVGEGLKAIDEKKIGGFADEVKGTFKNLKNLAETGETIITPEMREETKNTLKGLAEDAGEAASKEGGLFDQIKLLKQRVEGELGDITDLTGGLG